MLCDLLANFCFQIDGWIDNPIFHPKLFSDIEKLNFNNYGINTKLPFPLEKFNYHVSNILK